MYDNLSDATDEDFREEIQKLGGIETQEETTEETEISSNDTEEETVVDEGTHESVDTVEVEEEEEPSEKEDDGSDSTEEGDETEVTTTEETTPDYKEFYENIMKPFKANGKTVELKDPKDVVQLMQMGANFTRKMQDIAPHRKLLAALENNGLLDQEKLNLLIDVNNKNPEAIAQLLKQSKIDPLDIDVDTETEYKPKSYDVSDQEIALREVLDNLNSTDTGQSTLNHIVKDWDSTSKEFVYNEPEALTLIHEQRENGIYENIANEIDRRKVLGQIPQNMPFIEAYKTVGDELYAQPAPQKQAQPQVQPLERRAFKQESVNSNKAKAAGHTRTTTKGKAVVDITNMSDDAFKTFIDLNKQL